MPIARGHFGKALQPIVDVWFGKTYDEHDEQFTKLFDTYTADKAFIEEMSVVGFGLANTKDEGDAIQYDEMEQGHLTRYEMITYGLGFIVTREAFEDDQANVVAPRQAQELAFSMRQTQEEEGAAIYNNAFTSTVTYGDGKELLATDHPNISGGTFRNELATAADLSEASLEQAVIDIRTQLKTDRGLKIAIKAKQLIIPPALMHVAERLFASNFRVGTSDNDINAVKNMGSIPMGYFICDYLTDDDAWFIRTTAPHGMKYYERRKMEFGMDNDFDTENAKFKATWRGAFGNSDPRGLFGSPGA